MLVLHGAVVKIARAMLQGNFKSSFRDQSSFKMVLNITLGITSPMLVLHGTVLAYSREGRYPH